MLTIGAFEAKNRLSELLAAVEGGAEVVITKHGKPVARLVPVDRFDRAKVRKAIEDLKKFREEHSLSGLDIKELIDEGRKY